MNQFNFKHRTIKPIMLLAVAALLLFAFTTGGDSFSLSLNGKLIHEQHVTRDNKTVKTITLSAGAEADVLNIRYSHCGKTGHARNISVKDAQQKTLKTWHFPDSESAAANMSISVKELVVLQKNSAKLNLVYSSTELPDGKSLVMLAADASEARLK
jgi:hypothetical protein